MDWVIVTSGIVSLLTWFVTKTGESLAQKAGKEVFDFLKNKFKKDKEANNALSYFSKSPERYKSALTDILRDKAISNQDFGEKLLYFFNKNQEVLASGSKIVQTAIGDGIAQAIGTQASASVNLDKTELKNKSKKEK